MMTAAAAADSGGHFGHIRKMVGLKFPKISTKLPSRNGRSHRSAKCRKRRAHEICLEDVCEMGFKKE